MKWKQYVAKEDGKVSFDSYIFKSKDFQKVNKT